MMDLFALLARATCLVRLPVRSIAVGLPLLELM